MYASIEIRQSSLFYGPQRQYSSNNIIRPKNTNYLSIILNSSIYRQRIAAATYNK